MRNLFLTLFVFLLFIPNDISAGQEDSLLNVKRKNLLGIEFLGNNYLSPFYGFLNSEYGISPIAISYSRILIRPASCWQVSAGFGVFRSYYVQHSGSMPIYHRPIGVSIPIGFLWRPNYKRNSFWFGVFFISAVGKQQYVIPDQSYILHTIDYDYQIAPNICYQFRSKNEAIHFKIFVAPKISSGVLAKDNAGYKWRMFPVWGGISIGGGW